MANTTSGVPYYGHSKKTYSNYYGPDSTPLRSLYNHLLDDIPGYPVQTIHPPKP